MSTAYDEVIYPSAVYPETHPDRLAVIGLLSGLRPAPVDRCRVLELGCGDGFNVISMAYTLPESEFVGIDLAATPIARGNAVIQQLGSKNITLQARDVTEAGADLGEFDYIIAHGLYSWVPPRVREKIMELCGATLSRRGIAYISYNAYPGNHLRDLVRGMMRYHVGHFERPSDQIAQGRALVKLLAGAGDPKDPYMGILGRELDRITKYTDTGFFHDDLSPTNQPFYFHEFMARAAEHGLQYLGEAELTEKQELNYPAEVRSVLQQLDPADVIAGEQYRDFLRCRAFRRTLLCHQGIPLNRRLDAAPMQEIYVTGEIRSASAATDPHAAEMFIGLKKSELETNRPLVKAALRRVGAVWPDYAPLQQIVTLARNDAGRSGEDTLETDTEEVCAALLQAGIAGAVEVHSHRPPFVLEPGERPRASALARVQIQEGNRVSTLLHGIVQIEDGLSRLLLLLMDGTRDRATLCDALQQAVRSGSVDAVARDAGISEEKVDSVVKGLARLGLILA